MASSKKSGSARKPASTRKQTPTRSTSTSTPTSEQIHAVKVWILEGRDDYTIRQAIEASFPDTDPDKLIQTVLDAFAAFADADENVIRGWALEALRHLYEKMVEIGDYAGALKAIKELVRMTD